MKTEERSKAKKYILSGIIWALASLFFLWLNRYLFNDYASGRVVAHLWSSFGGLYLVTGVNLWWYRVRRAARGEIDTGTLKFGKLVIAVLLGIVSLIGSFSLAWLMATVSDLRLWFPIWAVGLLGASAFAWALNYAWYNRPLSYCPACNGLLYFVKEYGSMYCHSCGGYKQKLVT